MPNDKMAFVNVFRNSEGAEIYFERIISKLTPITERKTFFFSPIKFSLDCIWKKISGIERTIKPSIIIQFIFLIREIKILIRENHINTIVLNGERAIYLAPFLSKSVKKIAVKHMLVEQPMRLLKKVVFRLVSKKIDTIITISNFHVNHLIEVLGCQSQEKIHLIYNGVDEKKFRLTDNNQKEHKEFVFLETASLIQRKGQIDLLKAFSKICYKYNEARLVLAGTGELFEFLKELIAKQNLSDKVKLCGFITDTVSLLNECDVFLLPSYSEGLPLSILEAMSCSRPIIASDVAGTPELICEGENGFLIKAGDVETLSQKMIWCMENKSELKKMGEYSRSLIEEKFTEKEQVKRWAELLFLP